MEEEKNLENQTNNQFKQTTETLSDGVEVVSDIEPDKIIQKEISTEAEKEIDLDSVENIPLPQQKTPDSKTPATQITEKDLDITNQKQTNRAIEVKTSEVEDIKEKKVEQKDKKPGSGLKTVRTYQGDIAGILKDEKTSLSKIMTAEKEKKYSLAKTSDDVKKGLSNINPKKIIIGVLVFLVVLIGGYFIYTFIQNKINAPEIPVTELKIPNFIFPNYQREVFLKNTKKQTLLNAIIEEEKTISIPLGSIMQLFLTKEDTTKHFVVEGTEGNKTLLTTGVLFESLEAKNPASLTRALETDFMFGYHSSLGNKPFLLFKIASYENTFANMLTWEKTMYQDLSPIFKRDDTKLEQQNIYEFKDVVIVNKDVRAVLNKEGKIEFAYSFPNKNTLIITNNESTLEEIFRRTNTASLERTN